LSTIARCRGIGWHWTTTSCGNPLTGPPLATILRGSLDSPDASGIAAFGPPRTSGPTASDQDLVARQTGPPRSYEGKAVLDIGSVGQSARQGSPRHRYTGPQRGCRGGKKQQWPHSGHGRGERGEPSAISGPGSPPSTHAAAASHPPQSQ
jgi:hypothetical protein